MNRFSRIAIMTGIVLLFVSFSESALAQATFRDCEGYMWRGGWFFGPFMMIFFLLVSVLAIVLLVRWLTGSEKRQRAAQSDPLAILKERFARGEIDKEEYEARRKVLKLP